MAWFQCYIRGESFRGQMIGKTLIVVQEAIELTEHDWEMLTRPLRNGVMPYQQIIGDTNPDAPGHWLKKREAEGRTKFIESRHEDNPVLWDVKHAT